MLETTQVHVTHYINLFNYDAEKSTVGLESRVKIDKNNGQKRNKCTYYKNTFWYF